MLQSLDTSKANGLDGISARMLKSTAYSIAPSITKLFNHSIACGKPPSNWKKSAIVPIPKVSRARNTSDFRPISLLPILSKVLERHLVFYINSHLSEHSPLANCQWGFQKGKSTVSALLHVTHDWFQHLERNHEVGAVFFDFRKAFDSVPHEPLLSKLKVLNLAHNVYVWLHNYLAGRQQKVVLNGVSSETSPVTSGVPQGSILGPILFLIYIDDIVKANISQGSTLVLYADDILLYRPICTSEDYFFLQRDIDSISNWASTNKMTFNTSKCKSMLISRKRTHCLPATPLHLNGSPLEIVSTFKYLGVLVSSNLQWSPHIQEVCSKARKIIGLLYRRYYQHSDPSTLLHLYLSLVRPHTEYAAQVWDPHLYKDISSLENIQKFALRVCCKNWNLGYSELLDVCKVPSLENRRLYLKLCHMFKIVNNLCYFPPEIVVQRSTVPYSLRPSLLQQPFCRTSAFAHSFVPDTIRKWNCLPIELTSTHTLHSFQSSLSVFTC